MRSITLRFIACLVLAPLSAARADDTVLHEYVPNLDAREVTAALHSKPETAAIAEPAEVDNAGHAGSAASQPSAASHSQPHSENFRPDRLTSLEGGLDYYAAFNPSIAPFKRVMALDATRLDVDGKTPVLGIHDVRHRTVPIESPGAEPPDARPRDRFVGELDVDFHDQRTQSLPSVSPESRILGISGQPKVALQVERDGADNYYVRVTGDLPEGSTHISFTTDAPRSYFGAVIPPIPLRALSDEVPALPPSISKRALRFAAQLGITPRSDLQTALQALTRHFRAFVESASPPDNTGDLYLDLVRSSKGLCRHRAYGFVVTAQALGIPARFVQNEAHSWVEVKIEGSGYLRIDLGGAAHGLTAHNVRDRPSYVPAQPDTLPRPESYRQSYAQAAARNPAAMQASTDASDMAGRWLPERAPAARAGLATTVAEGPLSQADGDAPSTQGKTPLHVTLDQHRVNALRGGKLVLTGRMLDEAQGGVADLRVEIWIVRDKQHQRMLLGVSVSDADGYFRAAFGVPPDLAVGDYRLIVVSDGDAKHLPVIAQ